MGERRDDRRLIIPAAGGGIVDDLVHGLRQGADALLTILFAPTCLACHCPLDTPLAGPICDPCWHSVPLLPPAVCDACGDPLLAAVAGAAAPARCARCRRGEHRISRGRSAGVYDGALRAAIHGLKYDGRRTLARRLSDLMRRHAGDVLAGADAVVPVPLHASRQRARGFNQSNDLARHLGLPVVRALRRVRATPPQAELPAGDRQTNLVGAFAASRRMAGWGGAILVLVDDVTTTGATLDACADVLLDAGAAEVRAITAARTAKLQP